MPLENDGVPLHFLGLVEEVKAYETLLIQAAVSGDRTKVLLALMNHPLVHEVKDARKMVDEMMEANREFLPQFYPEKL